MEQKLPCFLPLRCATSVLDHRATMSGWWLGDPRADAGEQPPREQGGRCDDFVVQMDGNGYLEPN